MSSPNLPAFVHSPTWSRYRRLKFTGPNNPSYQRGRAHGRWTRYRRTRLEAPLGYVLQKLQKVVVVITRVNRLPIASRARVAELAGWLMGECHPDTWALRDPRLGKPARWYVPRCAWAFCAAWLRQARVLERLLTLSTTLIAGSMPPLLQRGPRGINQERKDATHEVERLRAWSRAHGIPWEGDPKTP